VFRYSFPEYLCVDGFSNTTWKLTHPQKARRVFLDGERFDIHGYDQRIKKIINLRKRIKPFIDWPAVFKDIIGLTVSDERVQARAFWRTDGENRIIAVTMMNEDGVEGATVDVDLGPIGTPKAVHLFTLDGRVVRLPIDGDDRVTIPVPTDGVSAAVIGSQVAPELAAWAWLEQIMRPGDDGLAMALFFPVGSPGEVSVDMSTPPGLFGQPVDVDAESDCLRRMELPCAGSLSDLKRWERLETEFNWGPAGVKPWTIMAPPLVNGNFEDVEDGRLVYWGAPPCTEDPGEGDYCIRVDSETAPHKHISNLTPVKPNCRYRFRAMLKRHPDATGGVGAHVVEYEEGLKFERSAALNSHKAGEWEELECEFTTHADPRSTAIYLYNFDDDLPAWFDGLELEEIVP